MESLTPARGLAEEIVCAEVKIPVSLGRGEAEAGVSHFPAPPCITTSTMLANPPQGTVLAKLKSVMQQRPSLHQIPPIYREGAKKVYAF